MKQASSSIQDRRALLQALVLLAGVVVLPSSRAADAPGPAGATILAWLRAEGAIVLGDFAALDRPGERYLAQNPRERNQEYLAQRLAGDATTSVLDQLIEAISRDWRTSDVVTLDGWIYARTEARLCAIVHLAIGTSR